MATPAAPGPATAGTRAVREIATQVYCLGLGDRAQTNVYLVGTRSAWSLVDAGWTRDGPAIAAAAQLLFGAGAAPTSILLTHAHPDHAGAARELAQAWSCPIDVHPQDVPMAMGDFAAMVSTAGPLDRWLILPLMRALGRRRREALIARSSLTGFVRPLAAGGQVPGLPDWRWVPTPGHTPGHVSLFRAADRVAITGDAVVTLRVNSLAGVLLGRQGLSGPPWYTTWSSTVAARSIADLARLEPDVLAGGHGQPLMGPGTAASLDALATRVNRSRAGVAASG